MKVVVNPLYQLIAQGEHQWQDFKYCISDSRKIAKSLVAFANTDGGRLLVGVKDNGKIVGVQSDEEYYMVEAAARIYSNPPVLFDVQQWEADGKTVLEIQIAPSAEKPHYAENHEKQWIAYVRRNDENIVANRVLLKSWKLSKNPSGLLFKYDEPKKCLVNYLEENGEITLSKFTRLAQINHFMAENILAEFLNMNCITLESSGNASKYLLNNEFDLTLLS